MLQRFVDHVLAVTKESVKTFTYESFNNIVRLINGVSALLLSVLPGEASILEGIQGWELRPTFREPRLPRWMENGVSSFNQFIHELSVDSDASSVDYSSGEEDYDEDSSPASPMSQTSRISHSSSFMKYDRRRMRSVKYLLAWILWPVTFILRVLLRICHGICCRIFRLAPRNIQTDRQSSHLQSAKKAHLVKDHVVHRTTDRRRGVVEDLQLGIEIFIEAVFDNVHKAAHFLLSPSEAYQTFTRWFSSTKNGDEIKSVDDVDVSSIPSATLGDPDPTAIERQETLRHSLNTDGRTCRDVITELGYPYEAIRVVTSDGYVLLLERIPRKDSRKVVYLQHGILDTSMGWVSNGVVGSPAFAAFDQGYDVFLGNFRGLVSREHTDKNISSRRYWRYSINEHGIQDIPAMIEKIHQIKISELKINEEINTEDETNNQPYKMGTVCHSLGGAAMLMYVITRRLERKPHRLSRLILLSPAGFHEDSTIAFSIVQYLLLMLAPILAPIFPGLYIPTRFFRMLFNKLARDFQNYPALGGLVQTLMSYVVGGDSSNWIGIIGLPHYNMYDMPGVSFHVAVHLAQMKRAKKFIMYDYGKARSNMEAYGSPEPFDLGAHYGLIDVPVDLVGGRKDKVIRSSMVRKHYRLMKNAGVDVSYNEFEYAHLDFTFSHREELLTYVMSRLLLVSPVEKQNNHLGIRVRRTYRNQRGSSSSPHRKDVEGAVSEIEPFETQ
ncbi:Triacylglycerol lipase 2 [Acorus gramineus]|uniref:Triacylglycerol lipase 2 n=1 Tax=Acorus gramineus TaxID=55184 RepID=A0AAV9AZT9_ACOGR|nr:Triacylglycerol lipase 2 [Acorus gramineus]